MQPCFLLGHNAYSACVMITREDAAIEYSRLRHKASPQCHTRSVSGERQSRQFSSMNQDSSENPPGDNSETSQAEDQGLRLSKSESYGLAELACHGVQRSVPHENRKEVLNEPLNPCGAFSCPTDV